MAATASTEKPKQPVIDPEIQRAKNHKRDERRNVVFAAIYAAAGAKAQPGVPIAPSFTIEEVAAFVPDEHRIAVTDVVGLAFNQGFIAAGFDPISNQVIESQFRILPAGEGAFVAANAAARHLLVQPAATKAPSPAATASGSAKP